MSRRGAGGGRAAPPWAWRLASPALIDLPTVAQRLGVNERHVRRLVAERRIPFLKWGHLLRFDPAEIEAWLDAGRVSIER
jgi:excisionase family DNA binding protein